MMLDLVYNIEILNVTLTVRCLEMKAGCCFHASVFVDTMAIIDNAYCVFIDEFILSGSDQLRYYQSQHDEDAAYIQFKIKGK